MAQRFILSLLVLATLINAEKLIKVHRHKKHQGMYYVKLYIGEPYNERSLLIDTTTALSTMPCAGCYECRGKEEMYYDPEYSSSSDIIECDDDYECLNCDDYAFDSCSYSFEFQNGSMNTGYLVLDRVYAGLNEEGEGIEMDVVFGCNQLEIWDHDNIADGVFALGKDDVFAYPSVLEFMHETREISSESYSICLGNEGGFINVGKPHKDDGVDFVELEKNYYFSVTGWSVGDIETDIEPEDMINLLEENTYLDSTIPITLVRDPVFDMLVDAFDEFCDKPEKCQGYPLDEDDEMSYCFKHDPEALSVDEFFQSFPTLSIFIEGPDGVEVKWEPKNYFVPFKHQKNVHCIGIERSLSTEVLGTRFGLNFMRNLEIRFDRKHDIIGFNPMDCDSVEIEEDKPPKEEIGPKGHKDHTKDHEKHMSDKKKSEDEEDDHDHPRGPPLGFIAVVVIAVGLSLGAVYWFVRRCKRSRYETMEREHLEMRG